MSHSNNVVVDRYLEVGLTGNPFAAHPSNTHLEAVFIDRGLGEPPPSGSRTLVQVIGHRGFGKSTHLAHWRRRTPGPYHHVPRHPYRARWSRPPVAPLVYGDEIDRMPGALRLVWLRRLARIQATVVVGTHVDLGAAGRRAGLTVVTHRLQPAGRHLIEEFVNRRLRATTIDSHSSGITVRPEEFDEIHRRSGGSLREVEVLCHRLVAERVM